MQIIIARGGRYLIVLKVSSARAKCLGRQMQKVLSSTSISLSSRTEGWWCQRYYCRSRVQNQVRRMETNWWLQLHICVGYRRLYAVAWTSMTRTTTSTLLSLYCNCGLMGDGGWGTLAGVDVTFAVVSL